MINNCLDILKSWCKPLGGANVEHYAILLRNLANQSFSLAAIVPAKIMYLEGGVPKTTYTTSVFENVSVPSDASSQIKISAQIISYIIATEAQFITAAGDDFLQLEVGADITQIDLSSCPNLQYLTSAEATLPNLYSMRIRVNEYTAYQDVIALCQRSTYGGQKRLYLYPDDAYYSQTKTDAQNEGWVVFDLPI